MPMAQQRRQQMFDDAALAGFDLHRRRHTGRKTGGAFYFSAHLWAGKHEQ